MHAPTVSIHAPLSRRHLLRGTGAALALPLLDAMVPGFGRAREAETSPPRFLACCAGLGFHTPFLFPAEEGRAYEPTPYLQALGDHRDDLTLFSGLSHPDQNGNNGHASELTWLTAARRPGLAGFRNTISLDQVMANHHTGKTRLPFLALSNAGRGLAWSANGVPIPGESRPSQLFKQMFVNGTKNEIAEEIRRHARGRSILDTVRGEARRLEGHLGPRDREKLDEYFGSVRDLERRLQDNEAWADRPKPPVEAKPPLDVADKHDTIAKQRLIYDMILLALQTDSTRTVTYAVNGMNAVPSNIPGVKTDWHNLSHHGKDEQKIAELRLIEEAEFKVFGEFLARMKDVRDGGQRLLDRTAILYGSNLGNASAHDWRNLPVVLAGGPFKHGGHVAHDRENNTPFANLFVHLLQHMGVATDHFGSSTAVGLRGLEPA